MGDEEKMKCEFPKCNAEATFKLSLADPDAEGSFYCSGHVDIRKHQIMIDMFTNFEERRCVAFRTTGNKCLNSKKFGDLCGIHSKMKTVVIK